MGGIEQLKELMSINTCIEIDEIEKYFNQIVIRVLLKRRLIRL